MTDAEENVDERIAEANDLDPEIKEAREAVEKARKTYDDSEGDAREQAHQDLQEALDAEKDATDARDAALGGVDVKDIGEFGNGDAEEMNDSVKEKFKKYLKNLGEVIGKSLGMSSENPPTEEEINEAAEQLSKDPSFLKKIRDGGLDLLSKNLVAIIVGLLVYHYYGGEIPKALNDMIDKYAGCCGRFKSNTGSTGIECNGFMSVEDWKDTKETDKLKDVCTCFNSDGKSEMSTLPNKTLTTFMANFANVDESEVTCDKWNYKYKSCDIPCIVAAIAAATIDIAKDTICATLGIPYYTCNSKYVVNKYKWVFVAIAIFIVLLIVGKLYAEFK